MSSAENPYRSPSSEMAWGGFAAAAPVDERVAFIRRTYAHLIGAIFAFAVLATVLIQAGVGLKLVEVLGRQPMGWIVVMLVFMGGSYLAQTWAHNSTTAGGQYMGLALYVVLEALIFTPILTYAATFAPNVIASAGIVTLTIFGGLSFIVFFTKQDFSFLRSALVAGSFAMMGVAICAMIFGFHIGMLYAGIGVLLASGFILYDTSNVLHHYRTDQHVGAALELFASVALLFWYVLRIFLEMQRD